MAMEGPTPVSSLLHSSTIVVAGVFLWMVIGYKGVLIIVVVFCISLVWRVIFFSDLKKNIAFSTSSNLGLIFLMSSMRLYSLVLIHIITHAFVKAGVFIESRVIIHSSGSQDLRVMAPLNLGMWLLIRIVVYMISKEIVVVEVRLVGFLLFLLC
jgi:NADH:ubiquinone oxidoreductase subunit 5 (subunit L)/multisubunit Na+/H+ antiporter MnhA subunit